MKKDHLKYNTKGVIAVFVIGIFLFSLIPAALAENGKQKGENKTKDNRKSKTNAGINPDSALYGLDVALDNIRHLLAANTDAKAKVGLEIAEERLAEVREMIQKNKLKEAKRANHEHEKAMARVKADIAKHKGKSDRDEIKINEKKNEIKIKVEIGKGDNENKTKHDEEKREKAKEQIEVAAEAIAKAETKLNTSNASSSSASKLIAEAELHLSRARTAFNQGKFGEAFGQANAAEHLAVNAMRVLEHKETEEDEDEEGRISGVVFNDINSNGIRNDNDHGIANWTLFLDTNNNSVGGGNMAKKYFYGEEDTEEDDMNIYSKQLRESMLEDDELSPIEEAFMNGYEEGI